MTEWTNKWMNEWTNKQTNERMNRQWTNNEPNTGCPVFTAFYDLPLRGT